MRVCDCMCAVNFQSNFEWTVSLFCHFSLWWIDFGSNFEFRRKKFRDFSSSSIKISSCVCLWLSGLPETICTSYNGMRQSFHFSFIECQNYLISFFVPSSLCSFAFLAIPFGCLFPFVLFRSAVSLLSPLHWQNRINIFYVTNLKLNAACIFHWLACANQAPHMQLAGKVALQSCIASANVWIGSHFFGVP